MEESSSSPSPAALADTTATLGSVATPVKNAWLVVSSPTLDTSGCGIGLTDSVYPCEGDGDACGGCVDTVLMSITCVVGYVGLVIDMRRAGSDVTMLMVASLSMGEPCVFSTPLCVGDRVCMLLLPPGLSVSTARGDGCGEAVETVFARF